MASRSASGVAIGKAFISHLQFIYHITIHVSDSTYSGAFNSFLLPPPILPGDRSSREGRPIASPSSSEKTSMSFQNSKSFGKITAPSNKRTFSSHQSWKALNPDLSLSSHVGDQSTLPFTKVKKAVYQQWGTGALQILFKKLFKKSSLIDTKINMPPSTGDSA